MRRTQEEQKRLQEEQKADMLAKEEALRQEISELQVIIASDVHITST